MMRQARFQRAWTRRVASALLAALASGLPARALACGASGGSVGASACSLAEHEEEVRKKWRVGASYAFSSTAIRFDGDTTLDETRHIALAALDYQPTRTFTLEFALGPLLAGSLHGQGARSDFRPGVVTALGTSYRLLRSSGARPFVLLTGQVAFVAAATREDASGRVPSVSYEALDVRLGGIAGWSLWDRFHPYALARAFGGPVFWRFRGSRVTGTDTHHYQVGAGLVLVAAKLLDVYVEGVPLGELGFTVGAGVAF